MALLDYHDAVIYQRDLANFHSGKWLNDACIGFRMKYMEVALFPDKPYILFMDPSVVSMLKVQILDEEDLESVSKGLNIMSRKLIFVPTSDNKSFTEPSSHWSLLVIDAVNYRVHHIDSSNQYNLDSAQLTYEKFQCILNWDKFPPINYVRNSPQQTNGYDCGVYVCLCVERFASSPILPLLLKIIEQREPCEEKSLDDIINDIKNYLTPTRASEYRKESIDLIEHLSKNYLEVE